MSEKNLQSFLYVLMRDHCPPGAVVEVIKGHVAKAADLEVTYTNTWLAAMAQEYTAAIIEGRAPHYPEMIHSVSPHKDSLTTGHIDGGDPGDIT